MMQKTVHILAVVRLLSATFACGAAAVTPATASDYLFSTPHRPAHIRGIVMGVPPAYFVPRSEDYDWIAEARNERLAMIGPWPAVSTNVVLKPEFGKWNLAETNRFVRWVTAVDESGSTNVVVGFNLVTNTPSSVLSPGAFVGLNGVNAGDTAAILYNPTGTIDYRQKYLDPDAPLVEDAKIYDSGAVYTNIYSLAAYTNGWTNATSTISMAMTNGTVSVYTNKWGASWEFPATFCYTNVFGSALLDACYAGDGSFPGYTNAPPALYSSESAAFSNDYAALRFAVRAATGTAIIPTNEFPKSVTTRYYDGAASGIQTNIAGTHFVYEITGSRRHWEQYNPTNEQYEVVWATDTSDTQTIPLQRTVTLQTTVPSYFVTAGQGGRVEVEAAYAVVLFSYSLTHDDGDIYETVTNISREVVLRVSAPGSLDVTGSVACENLTLDARSLFDAAAIAVGVTTPPQSAETFVPADGYYERWSASALSYLLIYKVRPSSKIADWQEELR